MSASVKASTSPLNIKMTSVSQKISLFGAPMPLSCQTSSQWSTFTISSRCVLKAAFAVNLSNFHLCALLILFSLHYQENWTSGAGRKGSRGRLQLRKLFEEIRTQALGQGERKGKRESNRWIRLRWRRGVWPTQFRPRSNGIPLESEADNSRYSMVPPSPHYIESPDYLGRSDRIWIDAHRPSARCIFLHNANEHSRSLDNRG